MVMKIARLGACSCSNDVARVTKGAPHRPRDRVEISATIFSLSSPVGSAVRHQLGFLAPSRAIPLYLRHCVRDVCWGAGDRLLHGSCRGVWRRRDETWSGK